MVDNLYYLCLHYIDKNLCSMEQIVDNLFSIDEKIQIMWIGLVRDPYSWDFLISEDKSR